MIAHCFVTTKYKLKYDTYHTSGICTVAAPRAEGSHSLVPHLRTVLIHPLHAKYPSGAITSKSVLQLYLTDGLSPPSPSPIPLRPSHSVRNMLTSIEVDALRDISIASRKGKNTVPSPDVWWAGDGPTQRPCRPSLVFHACSTSRAPLC